MKLSCRLQHGRNSDSSAKKHGSFSCCSVKIISIAKNTEDFHLIPFLIGRKFLCPLSCDPVHQTKAFLFPVDLTDTDRSGKQSAFILRIYPYELSGSCLICKICLDLQVKNIFRQGSLTEHPSGYLCFSAHFLSVPFCILACIPVSHHFTLLPGTLYCLRKWSFSLHLAVSLQ